MPELNQLFDALRRSALAQGQANGGSGSQQRQALVGSANDGSVLGYLEAFGVAVWDTAVGLRLERGADLERDGPAARVGAPAWARRCSSAF